MSLKRDAVWTGIDTVISSGLAFAFRLLIAKLLSPDAFGLIAMALTVYSVLQVIGDFGLTASLIQKDEAAFDKSLIASTFAMSTTVSLFLFVVTLLAIAPLSGLFYSSLQVGEMIAALAFCFLLTPFSSVSMALLYRARRFRDIAMARAIATFTGVAVAATFLLVFRSAWTVVVQVLLTQTLLSAQIVARAGWRPNLNWDRATMRSIFSYSGLVFANDVIVGLAKNLDVMVLGRLLTRADVGIYSLAFFLTDTARMNLMSILNRVMFVRYSQTQNDPNQLRSNYLNTMRWNCLILFPLMLLLILFGPDVVRRVYGAEWEGIDNVLRFLALAVMFHAAGGTSSTLYKAIGRPGLDLTLFISTTLGFLVPLLLIGALWGGVVAVAAAVAASKLLSVLVRQIVLDRFIGSTFAGVVRNVGLATAMLLPIFVVWAVGLWLVPERSLVRDFALPTVAIIGYGALLVGTEGRGALIARLKSRKR